MIVDLQQTDKINASHSDVCVVGAGAAGITMAVELVRLGLIVSVLEGGGLDFEEASQQLYQSNIVGLPHRGTHEGRFRVFGGTSTKWAGQILELADSDFERRSWVPGSGWPFPKSILSKYYERALEIEGLDKSILKDSDVWRSGDVTEPAFGQGIESFFSRFCPQPNFAKLHRRFLKSNPLATVYLHANLCEIELSASQNEIARLRCKTAGRPDSFFTASHFVFCLGGLETARILLQPLNSLSSAPWNRSSMLGHFFQDHLDVAVATLFPRRPKDFRLHFDNIYLGGFRYMPKIRADSRLQKKLQILAVGASFDPQSARQNTVETFRSTLHRYMRGEKRSFGKAEAGLTLEASDILIRKAWRYFRHRRAFNPDDLGIGLRVHCEQAPNSNSRVTLAEDRDATGLLKLCVNWRIGELELITIRNFVDHLARAMDVYEIAQVNILSERLQSVETLASYASDTFHHMGTVRMADSPQDGVVDSNCQLFGISNGYVCSSAVFPAGGFSNPTHTILALGVRLAEFISRKSTALNLSEMSMAGGAPEIWQH